jgi:hypothetical protein
MLCSESALCNEPKLSKNHLWKVLYKDGPFRPDPLTNMAVTGNSVIWLVDFLIVFSSETDFPNEPNLVGSTIGMFSIKMAHFVPIR